MSEGEDKTSSAVKELVEGKMKGEKKEVENYYVRLATNMVTTAKETRLVEDDTQDTFLKGALGVALAFLVLGQGGHLIRTVVGVAYPGYRSLKALLTEDKADDMLWLRYWVVLAAFTVLELGLDVVMSWAPGYLLAKMAFLAWCMAPIHENGSNVIFNQVVLPLFHKHEAKIDTLASSAQAKAEKLLQQAVERSIEK